MANNWIVSFQVPAEGYDTPCEAAEAAWDGLLNDSPPIATVHSNNNPHDTVEVDLSAD